MRHCAILIMFFAAILTSCQPTVVGSGPWVQKIDSEEASRLVLNFSAKMKKTHYLDLEDSRLEYDDNIKKWCLYYSSQRLLTLAEARQLIVTLVEEFLYRVNNHTVLSFQLGSYPFTADDLMVRINFESFFGRYVDPLYIGLIQLSCGCVHFYAFDIKDETGIDWSHDRFEPYFKSRELALIEREVEVPEYEVPTTPKKPSGFIYERYRPSF